MAAYCGCCGAEITSKTEACPVCGTPQHGMLPPGQHITLDVGADLDRLAAIDDGANRSGEEREDEIGLSEDPAA
jgi:hypothetical protein